ncbi:MAG: carboxypeptidase-like regulatory domain-containing protein [Planctomycetota bacterium]|nr:carboxypeptidase-like regulatory domain-containing protein [Planctomycetota bacterium]
MNSKLRPWVPTGGGSGRDGDRVGRREFLLETGGIALSLAAAAAGIFRFPAPALASGSDSADGTPPAGPSHEPSGSLGIVSLRSMRSGPCDGPVGRREGHETSWPVPSCQTAGYKVADGGVKDGAILTGFVRWEGEIPEPFRFDLLLKPEDLPYSRRREGETTKDSPRLIIDRESRGVRYTVVTVEGIAEGKPWPERRVEIVADHCEFFPHVVWLQAGKNFTGGNRDPIPNSMHAYRGKVGGETVFNWMLPSKGDTRSEPIEEPGVVMIVCDSGHKWESAYIYVSEHPYVDVTDEKGRFEITDIPPGEYEVKFWHEGWKVTPRRDAEGRIEQYLYSKDIIYKTSVSLGPREKKALTVLLNEAEEFRLSGDR